MTAPAEAWGEQDLRAYMFAVAYRMLGSVGEAEDVVQDALLKMHTAGGEVRSPKAYAATVTARLALDELRSARVRRRSSSSSPYRSRRPERYALGLPP